MKEDIEDIWSTSYAMQYEAANYGEGLVAWVMRAGHKLLESPYGVSQRFDKVLEVGAGSGIHIDYVRHSFQEYLMTDSSVAMLAEAQTRRTNERIKIATENAFELSFDDRQFDRVIASHVLEHLVNPHKALREWDRVLKPGGVLSIVLPCDPGIAWRLGRNLGPRQRAIKNGLAYDYVMAREHVNSITNLVSLIEYYFLERKATWWPCRIPLSDINLIYAVNITKQP